MVPYFILWITKNDPEKQVTAIRKAAVCWLAVEISMQQSQ